MLDDFNGNTCRAEGIFIAWTLTEQTGEARVIHYTIRIIRTFLIFEI